MGNVLSFLSSSPMVLGLSVGGNLLVGSLLGMSASKDIKTWYKKLKKPSWNPPNWIFAPVWSTLYSAMGIAAWIVWKQGGLQAQATPLAVYGLQLALNFVWQPLFFKGRHLNVALGEIAALFAACVATTVEFSKVSTAAGCLFAPTVAWVGFAAALNADLARRNPEAHKIEVDDEELDGDDVKKPLAT